MKNKRIKLGIALAAVSVVGLFSSSAAFSSAAAPPAAADAKGYDGFVDFIVGAGSDTTDSASWGWTDPPAASAYSGLNST